MREIKTVQKEGRLNRIASIDDRGAYNTHHLYRIEQKNHDNSIAWYIYFGRDGVANSDLLEIVKDRLTCVQTSELKSEEFALALYHVEKSLEYLNDYYVKYLGGEAVESS